MSKEIRPRCPECGGKPTKNGRQPVFIQRKKYWCQNWECQDCGRQFRYPRIGRVK